VLRVPFYLESLFLIIFLFLAFIVLLLSSSSCHWKKRVHFVEIGLPRKCCRVGFLLVGLSLSVKTDLGFATPVIRMERPTCVTLMLKRTFTSVSHVMGKVSDREAARLLLSSFHYLHYRLPFFFSLEMKVSEVIKKTYLLELLLKNILN
jgi:hypothetical protein